MKHLVPALALLVAACASGPVAVSNPPPTAAASAATSASPAPAASPAACRLPVASADAPTDGNPAHGAAGHGGFLQLPQATFATDAVSLGSYVPDVRRWLPVPRGWVSPDGRAYAYPEYRTAAGPATGIIHVVDVATGTDRPFSVPAPSMPVSWQPAGIYLAHVVPNSDARPQGLSLLDPATGALRQIVASGTWTLVAGDTAYGADLDSSLAAPPGGGGPGSANRVWRLALAGGQPGVVATFPGASVQLLGAGGQDLLVGIVTADRYTVKLGSTVVFDGPVTGPQPGAPVVEDGSTIWLSGPDAVWRSVGGAAAQRIAVPGLQLAIAAGACR